MSGKNEGPRPLPDGATLNPIELVLNKLTEVRRRGKGWRARCPAHDDANPSLDIDVGEGGRVLLICRSAGCTFNEISTAIGIRSAALNPSTGKTGRRVKKPLGRVVKVYDYRDEAATVLFQTVRYDPKDFRQRRSDGRGGWIWNIDGVRRVLYRLLELLNADLEIWVYIVEGEKDADRLADNGLVATTNPMGGGNWCKVDSSPLYGRRVVILRDNDDKGLKHQDTVLQNLVGRAKEIRVVDLPGLPPKGDVSDWLDAGHTVAELLSLVEAAQPVVAPPVSSELLPAAPSPEVWDPPIPFGQYDLPSFPLEAIPAELIAFREFCVAVASSLQVPLDSVVMLALSVGALALAKRIEVRVLPDWTEPVNIYVVVVMESGERKSGLFRLVTFPLAEFEQAENERLAPLIEQFRAELAVRGAELKHNQSQAAKAKKPEDRQAAREKVTELAEQIRTTKPILPLQLVADDATPEAIGQLLQEQEGRIALLSPEGDVFDLMSGRYSDGIGRLGVYLKGHAGDDHRMNRVGRPAEYVRNPAITVGLAVQPDVLRGLMEKPGLRGRGLLARLLYVLPVSLVGFRETKTPPVPANVSAGYARLVNGALNLTPTTDENEQPRPRGVRLATKAQVELDRFRERAEAELRVGGELSAIRDWGSKLPGAICRIAGVFHGLIHAERDPAAQPISAETMLCAITIGEYLTQHARAAFCEMGANPATALARRIMAWAKESRLDSFTRRDAFNAVRGAVQRVDELDDPLRLLAEHGFIREREVYRSGPGRKPSTSYDVNPHALSQNTQNAQNVAQHDDSAHSAQSAEGVAK